MSGPNYTREQYISRRDGRGYRCICNSATRSLCTRWTKMARRLPECVTRRFWRGVRKTNTCWYWTGAVDEKGYGRIRLAGSRRRVFVHRLAWAILCDRFPDEGELICHKCNNPVCVRPAKKHAYLGDYFTNNRDTVSSGNHKHDHLKYVIPPRGEAHPGAKLTAYKVRRIRKLHADKAGGYGKLGRHFGVHAMTIRSIVKRATWASV